MLFPNLPKPEGVRVATSSNIPIGLNDPTAVHVNIANEFVAVAKKTTPDSGDFILIEDSTSSVIGIKKKITIDSLPMASATNIGDGHIIYLPDQNNPNLIRFKTITTTSQAIIIEARPSTINFQLDPSHINLDLLQDGSIYKKYLNTERTKLAGIEDGADVTDVTNVTEAEELIPVNTHSDLTSSGQQLDSAVALKHTQGTDKTLGIQIENLDMGANRILACLDPVLPSDVATKNYVDSTAGDDANAIHKNKAAEFFSIDEKTSTKSTDLLLIEDSDDNWNKKKLKVANLSAAHDQQAIHKDVAAEIVTITNKSTPVGGDIFVIENSEDTVTPFSKNSVVLQDIKYPGMDTDSFHASVADEIGNKLQVKSTPVGADRIYLEDSEDAYNKKYLTLDTIPVAVKDVDAFHKDVIHEITALDEITNANDADILVEDQTSGQKFRLNIKNVPSAHDAYAIHYNGIDEFTKMDTRVPSEDDYVMVEINSSTASERQHKRVRVGDFPSGGGGQTNYGVNVGSESEYGHGIYHKKNGSALEFKRLGPTPGNLDDPCYITLNKAFGVNVNLHETGVKKLLHFPLDADNDIHYKGSLIHPDSMPHIADFTWDLVKVGAAAGSAALPIATGAAAAVTTLAEFVEDEIAAAVTECNTYTDTAIEGVEADLEAAQEELQDQIDEINRTAVLTLEDIGVGLELSYILAKEDTVLRQKALSNQGVYEFLQEYKRYGLIIEGEEEATNINIRAVGMTQEDSTGSDRLRLKLEDEGLCIIPLDQDYQKPNLNWDPTYLFSKGEVNDSSFTRENKITGLWSSGGITISQTKDGWGTTYDCYTVNFEPSQVNVDYYDDYTIANIYQTSVNRDNQGISRYGAMSSLMSQKPGVIKEQGQLTRFSLLFIDNSTVYTDDIKYPTPILGNLIAYKENPDPDTFESFFPWIDIYAGSDIFVNGLAVKKPPPISKTKKVARFVWRTTVVTAEIAGIVLLAFGEEFGGGLENPISCLYGWVNDDNDAIGDIAFRNISIKNTYGDGVLVYNTITTDSNYPNDTIQLELDPTKIVRLGTQVQDLNMGSHNITNLLDPTDSNLQYATTVNFVKNYVEQEIAPIRELAHEKDHDDGTDPLVEDLDLGGPTQGYGDVIPHKVINMADADQLSPHDGVNMNTLINYVNQHGGGGGTDEYAIHWNATDEIHGHLTLKTTPHADDELVIEDSENFWEKKRIKIPSLSDAGAIHYNVPNELNSFLTLKTTPIAGADILMIEDSEDNWTKKKVVFPEIFDIKAVHIDVASEIYSNIPPKETPNSNDVILIEDSDDNWNKKRVQYPSSNDATAIHTNIASEIYSHIPIKTTLSFDDVLVIEDSQNSWQKRKIRTEVLNKDATAFHKNISNEFTDLNQKLAIGPNDFFVIEDADDYYNKKKVSFANSGNFDPNAFHKNIWEEIKSLELKGNNEAGDIVVIEDSENYYSKKKVQLGSIAYQGSGFGASRSFYGLKNTSDYYDNRWPSFPFSIDLFSIYIGDQYSSPIDIITSQFGPLKVQSIRNSLETAPRVVEQIGDGSWTTYEFDGYGNGTTSGKLFYQYQTMVMLPYYMDQTLFLKIAYKTFDTIWGNWQSVEYGDSVANMGVPLCCTFYEEMVYIGTGTSYFYSGTAKIIAFSHETQPYIAHDFGTNHDVADMACIDHGHFMCVLRDTSTLEYSLYQSKDHGYNWSIVPSNLPQDYPITCGDFFFITDTILGLSPNNPAQGYFYISYDQGKNWNGPITITTEGTINKVIYIGYGILMACGSYGALADNALYAFSKDFGNTWISKTNPNFGGLLSLCFDEKESMIYFADSTNNKIAATEFQKNWTGVLTN